MEEDKCRQICTIQSKGGHWDTNYVSQNCPSFLQAWSTHPHSKIPHSSLPLPSPTPHASHTNLEIECGSSARIMLCILHQPPWLWEMWRCALIADEHICDISGPVLSLKVAEDKSWMAPLGTFFLKLLIIIPEQYKSRQWEQTPPLKAASVLSLSITWDHWTILRMCVVFSAQGYPIEKFRVVGDRSHSSYASLCDNNNFNYITI